jgi:predicted aspartyl protease
MTAGCQPRVEPVALPAPSVTIERGAPPARGTADAAPRAGGATDFWGALAALDLASAERAPGVADDERRFLGALRRLLDGDDRAADTTLVRLLVSARDSLLRFRARVLLTVVLAQREDWESLVSLERHTAGPAAESSGDPAAIERWALALGQSPPETVTFGATAAEVPLLLSAIGTPVVPVVVNGHPYRFWLDTGASMTMIASDVAAECGVRTLGVDTLEITTATGRVRARPAEVGRLELGAVALDHHRAAIVSADELALIRPTLPGEAAVVKIDGIIGFAAIRHLDLELDYRRMRLIVRRPVPHAGAGGAPGAEARNIVWLGYPIVRLVGERGEALQFALDTGADQTFVTRTLVAKLPPRRLAIERRRIAGVGGQQRLAVPIIPSLALGVGDRRLRLRNLLVRAPWRITFVDVDGVLGSDVGKDGRVRIDMTNGVFAVAK